MNACQQDQAADANIRYMRITIDCPHCGIGEHGIAFKPGKVVKSDQSCNPDRMDTAVKGSH